VDLRLRSILVRSFIMKTDVRFKDQQTKPKSSSLPLNSNINKTVAITGYLKNAKF
jgi:hypothetical protein